MKRIAFVMTVVSVLGFGLATDGLAQRATTPGDRGTATDTKRGTSADKADKKDTREAWKAPEGAMESKRIIGTRIKGADGKDLGEIDQLIVDSQSGKITHAVIGLGGLMGVGEKHVVVPWSDVKLSRAASGDKLQVTMDQATLDRAPRYERRTAATERTGPAASPATTPRSETAPKSKY